MRLTPVPILALLLSLAAAGATPVPAPSRPDPTKLKGYSPTGGEGVNVFEVPVNDTIDLGLASFVERVMGKAKKGDVIILKIKTFGGRIDAAVRIRDALLDTKATTVAYIDHRAISAGALISLACDTIIMSPGASIGAATPIELGQGGEAKPTSEKVVSYMRAEMRSTAETKGRRGDLAEAMVDASLGVPGVVDKGKLLTLTDARAVELGIANAITPSYEACLELLNLTHARHERADIDWGERLARFLTDPVVSSLLMSLGVLGLLVEFYTGGHGIGGAVGLACLGLFFFGQYAARLAGMEEVLLFIAGAVLLAVEIFVIPGFGFVGIAGIVAMGAALVMSLVELNLPFGVAFDLGYFQEAATLAAVRLAVVMIVIVVGMWAFSKYLPATHLGRRIILQSENAAVAGYVGTSDTKYTDLIGQVGRAVGTLRPAGIAEFGSRRVDVVSEGSYVEAGSAVRVLQVDGNRVVVRKVDPESEAGLG